MYAVNVKSSRYVIISKSKTELECEMKHAAQLLKQLTTPIAATLSTLDAHTLALTIMAWKDPSGVMVSSS